MQLLTPLSDSYWWTVKKERAVKDECEKWKRHIKQASVYGDGEGTKPRRMRRLADCSGSECDCAGAPVCVEVIQERAATVITTDGDTNQGLRQQDKHLEMKCSPLL